MNLMPVVTVLGGTSIFGGFGSVTCVVVGAFILGILKTSVNMLASAGYAAGIKWCGNNNCHAGTKICH